MSTHPESRQVVARLRDYIRDTAVAHLDEAAYRVAIETFKTVPLGIEDTIRLTFNEEIEQHRWVYLCYLAHLSSLRCEIDESTAQWLYGIAGNNDTPATYDERFYASLAILYVFSGSSTLEKMHQYYLRCILSKSSNLAIIPNLCKDIIYQRVTFAEPVILQLANQSLRALQLFSSDSPNQG